MSTLGLLTSREIARRLDLSKSGAYWRGKCPSCGYGSDTLLLSQRGRLTCVSCNDRDALNAVLARILGSEAIIAKNAAASVTKPSKADRTARTLESWSGAEPAPGTPADTYLTNRCLPGLATSPSLRYRADVSHPAERGRLPAMLALVSDVNGAPLALHRTYLTRNGRKANVAPCKASAGPIWGGAVRLSPVAEELVIGEGIESAASAGRILNLPAWAAISAGNLAKGLILPAGVRAVVIAADNDPAGKNAARQAAHRWKAEGRRVRIALPDQESADFNDILMEQANG